MTRPGLTAVLGLFSLPLFALNDLVTVKQGVLEGGPASTGSAVHAYKGIPYATPPVGDLRWREPQPPAPWKGTRPAKEFSNICIQEPYAPNSFYYQPPVPMSEDCLYLNVWSGAKTAAERRPVMVWIHGGAFTRGAASTPVYDGENLAKKGVVVVTINYRLGLLGFLAHPDLTKESEHHTSGNYGLLDQLAALQWVQKNIAAFGGDPLHVTIFGESAGSWSVNYLTAAPLAKGLFHRAIGESGGNFQILRTLATAERNGVLFFNTIGTGSLTELRLKSADKIVKRPENNMFTPNVDGYVLPADVYTTFSSGKQNDVPTLLGYNADEGTSLVPYPTNTVADAFTVVERKRFGDLSDDFFKLYPVDTPEHMVTSHYASYRDRSFAWQMRTWARLQTKSGKSKVWMYHFSHPPPGPESSKYRAFHAAEIAYVFNNLQPPRPWEDADRKLADAMSSYWVQFATTGDPNAKGLPKWAPYEAKSDTAIEFGDTISPVNNVSRAELDFFDRYFALLRANGR